MLFLTDPHPGGLNGKRARIVAALSRHEVNASRLCGVYKGIIDERLLPFRPFRSITSFTLSLMAATCAFTSSTRHELAFLG